MADEEPKKEETKPEAAPAPMPSSGSGTGLDPKVGGLLAYLFTFVSGIILYLISKDKFIRFHALQSTIFFLGVNIIAIVIAFIPFIGLLSSLIYLVEFVMWIVLMVKAYQGEKFKIPVIGNIAEERA